VSHPSRLPSEPSSVTAIESPDDIRQALEARQRPPLAPRSRRPIQPGAPAEPSLSPASEAEPSSVPRSAAPYRPTFRASIGLLTVCDDGRPDGEVIRLRADRFVIGRTEGDLVLPHDELISGRHVEISRQRVGEGWRWIVTDLKTTNGLFVRISRTVLSDGAEFLVGRGRYRFDNAPSPPAGQAADPPSSGTRPWGAKVFGHQVPVLVELLGGMDAARFPLSAPENWIGSDPACAIHRTDDPFVQSRHVCLACGAGGAWEARNNKALNGLWLKVPQITATGVCLFQVGEQRFRLSPGG
jgi:hypothetical protein